MKLGKRFVGCLGLYLITSIGTTAQTTDRRGDSANATAPSERGDSIDKEAMVREVTVTSGATTRRMGGAMNGVSIGRQELFKAACCNLGESFTTNPSVDVSYSDAATGAKQIKLLGLSGTYVQMLTEQQPNLQGAALPYSLDYVPGPWMQSIQVSKGASTVKNGYESMTGQIDIEFLKPNDTEQLNANLYADSKARLEANVSGNIHLSPQLSTIILGHAEKSFANHDDNGDGFLDMPKREQYHLSNRWKLVTGRYLMHAGLSALKDKRTGGQTEHIHGGTQHAAFLPLYTINTEADRYEGYMKHALILSAERQSNLALMANGSLHLQDAEYGLQQYGNNEKTLNTQLMYETNLGEHHQLSVGTTLNHYYSKQTFNKYYMGTATPTLEPVRPDQWYRGQIKEQETTTGGYAQYTLNTGKLTLMAGLRGDHSDVWGWFVTPRLHLRYAPSQLLTMRLSAGKGYRTPHFYVENHFLMASSRSIYFKEHPKQEEAWNMGLNTAWNIPLRGRTLKLNAEYYYTDFSEQTVVDYQEGYSATGDALQQIPARIVVSNLHGRSYSHTIQVDGTMNIAEGLTLTAAWRWNDVKCTYVNMLTGKHERLERPLTSRYKGLLSLSFAPGLQLWHFDATLQLNGGGRIVGHERFHAYEQLQAQVTRDFRNISVYVGGENLTNFRQKNPVRGADDPWGEAFDATLVWGPVHGPLFYIGLRYNLEKK